jgi:predicted DNA-binding protein (MmcQ/YjbR family)
VTMHLPALRQFALSLPHTTVVNQWGGLVFKVAGKVFLIVGLDAEMIDGVTFKCAPDAEFDELTDIDGITQAPYCAKRHWVRVGDLTALPAEELERGIRHSYELVIANLPKKVQAGLVN